MEPMLTIMPLEAIKSGANAWFTATRPNRFTSNILFVTATWESSNGTLYPACCQSKNKALVQTRLSPPELFTGISSTAIGSSPDTLNDLRNWKSSVTSKGSISRPKFFEMRNFNEISSSCKDTKALLVEFPSPGVSNPTFTAPVYQHWFLAHNCGGNVWYLAGDQSWFFANTARCIWNKPMGKWLRQGGKPKISTRETSLPSRWDVYL